MTDRVTRDDVLMKTAELWALRSTCKKANGAVISKDGRIISIGYNGSPPGTPHCIDVGCLPDREGGCIRTIHAELNAVAWAARIGVSTYGATVHCTTSPCLVCAKALIAAGIQEVVYRDLYRNPAGLDLLLATVERVRGYGQKE